MSSQDFEKTLREWLRQGEASDAGPDPGAVWREGRRRRTRRVLLGGAAGLGLVAAAAAGVLALGGGLLPEAGDTGPAAPGPTAPPSTGTSGERTSPPTGERTEETAPEDSARDETEGTGRAGADDGEDRDAGHGGAQDGRREDDWGQPLAECSTGAYDADAESLDTDGLPERVAETATALLRGAMRCDQQALVERAEQDGTVLTYGGLSAEEALAVPQEDPRYLKLAVMLSATSWATTDEGGRTLYVWPAAHAPRSTEADWQEVIEAGLHSEEEIATMPGPGEAYFGWRIGITEDGAWQFFVAGD